VKISTKSFILAASLMAICAAPSAKEEGKSVEKNLAEEAEATEKIGLMPFASLDFGSAKVGEESKIVGGFTLGAEYTVFRKKEFSTNSKVTIKSFSREESGLFHTTDVRGNALLVGQTANYDFQFLGSDWQAFGQAELGYGLISAKSSLSGSFFGQDISAEAEGTGGSVIADASIGLRYYMKNNIVPFIAGGYRYFKATGLENEGDEVMAANLPSDIDMSTAFVSIGAGFQF
jgi:hypothetical protein